MEEYLYWKCDIVAKYSTTAVLERTRPEVFRANLERNETNFNFLRPPEGQLGFIEGAPRQEVEQFTFWYSQRLVLGR